MIYRMFNCAFYIAKTRKNVGDINVSIYSNPNRKQYAYFAK